MRFTLVICFLIAAASAHAKPHGIGVIGDSLAVGSLSHPDVFWDVERFQKYLGTNPRPNLSLYEKDFQSSIPYEGKIKPPRRYWESPDEHEKPDFAKQLELEMARPMLVGGYIDIEEYGWPYLVGRAEEVRPDWIFIAAEGGNRSGDALRQSKRLLSHLSDTLPEQVFIFFAGNDLCSLGLTENVDDVRKGWADRVFSGVEELIRKGKTPFGVDTKIYILPMLDPTDLIDSESILEKKTYAFGKERSCREFRDFDPSQQDESAKMGVEMKLVIKALKGNNNFPPAVSECRSVLSIKKDAADYPEKRANLVKYVRAIQEGARDVRDRAEKLLGAMENPPRIKIIVPKATESIRFEADDIANDCFHLSLHGQEKLARGLLREIK